MSISLNPILPAKGEITTLTFPSGLQLELIAVGKDMAMVQVTIGDDEPTIISMPVGSILTTDLTLRINNG